MAKVSDAARKLKAMREEAGLTIQTVADALGMPKSTYASNEDKFKKPYLPVTLVEKLVPIFKRRGISEDRILALAGVLQPTEISSGTNRRKAGIAGQNQLNISSERVKRAEDNYTSLTEIVYVIGSVQAGAWKEACQLPEEEWTEMRLPSDRRFPGITRYALKNQGYSMNRVCRDGGFWVFVRYTDLPGQGPDVGHYVIVERRRTDGLVEATAKRFQLDSAGVPMLYPESDDPSFQPFPLIGGPEIEEICIIGRVVDIINPV